MAEQPEQKPQGNTIPKQGETQDRVPRGPHERDESADSQAADEPSGKQMGAKAHDDITGGLQDTGKMPELEKTYDKLRDSGTTPPTEDKPRR
jgi:hypothetical protein